MATRKKNPAVFIVKKYPYKHPAELELVPVGAEVDLSHLPVKDRVVLASKGLMEPTTDDALVIAGPVKKDEPPKLNKYGLPFGQVPEKKGG